MRFINFVVYRVFILVKPIDIIEIFMYMTIKTLLSIHFIKSTVVSLETGIISLF